MLYVTDGTKEGFLTAFLAAFSDADALLVSDQAVTQLPLTALPITIQPDLTRAEKAAKRLQQFDKHFLHDLDFLLRSGNENNLQIAFAYCKRLAEIKHPISSRLSEPAVYDAVALIRQVGFEIHRFHGFIRFMESASGALYAPFSPDNDICDLLVPHFRARLPEYPFVLHDVKRKKAAVYDGQHCFCAPLEKADILLSANELGWQSLWKEYYGAVNIPLRERLKQMRGYMPKRYWAFMPERQNPPENSKKD